MEIIEQRIQTVIGDREHGSRWLAREALLILYDIATGKSANTQTIPADNAQEAAQERQLITSAAQIAEARPAMAALANAMGQVVSVHSEGLAAMGAVAQQILDTYETATQQMTEYAQPLISGQIMTCSISGTVLAVLQALKDQIEHVFVLEGRPRYEGRNTAQVLSEMGIATTLITDAQADIFLPLCQSVVVGADSLLINGDVLNKAGTALLAWASHGHGIPFYVLCETLKISARRWYEHDSQHRASNLQLLEEKEPQEVWATPPTDIHVHNYYFDHTPYRLVTSIISEVGLLQRREIRDRAVTTRAQLRLLNNLAKK